MEIVSSLFVEDFDIRQEPGGSARLDLGGVYFSTTASDGFPLTLEPHLLVLVRCPLDHGGMGALVVKFQRTGEDGDLEQIAQNRQPLQVDPGKFNYRLIKAKLTWEEPGTIEAHCQIDAGHVTVVPLTVNAPTG
ncbi:MAG: hypothetical protein GY708_04515 [Actinomycetia bacterium]|nr:hypothetical protein [Actinomycetes bacterium]MCP4960643.1 hypothetical protein [Actinomycetes bacterium]